MAFLHETLHTLLLLTFSTCCCSSISTFSSASTLAASATNKPQRLVSKLIHHRSILHPHYNPNESIEDRIEHDIQHSIARLAYLEARIESSLPSIDYKTYLSPSLTGRTILANISIGQPPVPQLLIMDTASDIFWIMCTPCSNCDKHIGPLFDPSKSSTFSPECFIPCGSKYCKCSLSDQFTFSITYADNSSSIGTIGHETLIFDTSDEGTAQVSNIRFGCGHNIVHNSDPGYNGVLALDNARHSLASQVGQKFSYCIGSLTNKNYNYNQLVLGEGADLEGYPTSFHALNDLYYITMEGISVGEKRLDISPQVFEIKADGTGGVILDTGSTLTYLVDDVYDLVSKEVRNLIGLTFKQVRISKIPWWLCYSGGSVSRDLVGFPVVTFHFGKGAELTLDSESFFEQITDDIFCMAIAPTSGTSIKSKPSVIGLLAQQSYNVGYDLINHLIYFQRIDCELLYG